MLQSVIKASNTEYELNRLKYFFFVLNISYFASVFINVNYSFLFKKVEFNEIQLCQSLSIQHKIFKDIFVKCKQLCFLKTVNNKIIV
jgi:hypothetical protein